mmetsp:Transcript_23535/g.42455  ORF Transcript_23535/g.42455 Transcript_23535/m.42455 type:complete len:373 (+) Transcript_23535:142-1260(+)
MLELFQVPIQLAQAKFCCQVYSSRLSSRSFWQLLHDGQDLWAPLVLKHLFLRQPLPQAEQLNCLSLLRNNNHSNSFAKNSMRTREAKNILYICMLPHSVLDLKGRDFLTSAVDELLETSDEIKVALLVYPAFVATPHEAIRESFSVWILVHVRSHLIATHHSWSANANFAFLSRAHALVAWPSCHNSELWSDRRAHRLQLPNAKSRVRAKRIGLRHGVSRQHSGLEEFFHLFGQRWQQSCGVIPDDPQRALEGLGFLGQTHQRHVMSWHCGVAGSFRLLHHCLEEGMRLVNAWQSHKARAAEGRHQKIFHQTSNVEHGHSVDKNIIGTKKISSSVAHTSYGHALMRDWNDLGLLRSARSVQNQAHMFPLHGF